MSDDESHALGGGSGAADDEVALPKATVAKLIQEFLPEGFSAAKDAKDLITECCKEFVIAISSEANEITEKDSKKTMMPEHILAALKALGFEQFVEETESVMKDHKETTKTERTRKKTKFNGSGLSAEELEAVQAQLFAQSKARLESGEGQS